MISKWYALKKLFLTKFGDMKVFPAPMFFVYQPTTFRVKGQETRHIEDLVLPGDVLLRSYRNYLDGYFIPKGNSECSHSGVYVGDAVVVHSIAEGASEIDIIDFCRADKVVVLRPKHGAAFAVEHAQKCANANIEYDFDFTPDSGKYYCHELTRSCFPNLAIPEVRRKVLGIFNSPPIYLADSFYDNDECFRVIHENTFWRKPRRHETRAASPPM